MTVPVFPTGLVSGVTRTLSASAATVQSPFSGTQDVQDWGGSWWEYTIDVILRKDADGRALSAFLAKLRGPVTPFLFTDPATSQGGSYGTPLVDGGSQTGGTLVTDGWSATGLLAGDFFSMGSDEDTRLYQITADVSPSAGAATLEFVPNLRTSPDDGDALNVTAPQVLLRLTSPVPTSIDPGDLYKFSLTAREAI